MASAQRPPAAREAGAAPDLISVAGAEEAQDKEKGEGELGPGSPGGSQGKGSDQGSGGSAEGCAEGLPNGGSDADSQPLPGLNFGDNGDESLWRPPGEGLVGNPVISPGAGPAPGDAHVPLTGAGAGPRAAGIMAPNSVLVTDEERKARRRRCVPPSVVMHVCFYKEGLHNVPGAEERCMVRWYAASTACCVHCAHISYSISSFR